MRTMPQNIVFGNGRLLFPGLVLLVVNQVVLAQEWTPTSAPSNWWRCIASSADGSKLVAGQWPGGIYVSTNSGATWATTTATNEYWSCVASSADGFKLLAGAANDIGPGGLFTSTNSGATWASNSLPSMYWGSVASSADGNTLAAAAPSGESLQTPGAIFCSTNGGINWMSNAFNNPNVLPQYIPISVAASADGKKIVVAASYNFFRSTNSGATWTQETNAPAIISGYLSPSQYIASSADGTKLALCAPQSDDGSPIYVSTNSGDTWSLTSAPSNSWEFITMSANGNMIAAMTGVEQPGLIYVSTNLGAAWTTNSPIFNWSAVASSADGGELAAAAFQDSDYDINSGKIYLSQTVVPPIMAIGPAGNRVQLSWLVPSTNFVLQQCSHFATWMDMTNIPVLNPDNLQYAVTIPSTNGAGFYRLKTP